MKAPSGPIYVTQPSLPSIELFYEKLKEIWGSKWLTNNGQFHKDFENALAEYLGVKYISVFSNGTIALLTALKALKITGEVITTPYSFVATTHALKWNGIQPVFCDIEPKFGNLDPKKIEPLITSKTNALLPVHVYGNPAKVVEIQEIADAFNLKVIYDAAHAFGVKVNGQSVLNFGDLSVLSFHATKTFNTMEGGAIVCSNQKMKKHLDHLKNFGFTNETTVVEVGINGKMNEMQAAVGLLQLENIKEDIEKREKIAMQYKNSLSLIDGICVIDGCDSMTQNYSYFPIFINEKEFGQTRDALYYKLQEHNIFGRRYFYPLISDFPIYKDIPSSNPKTLPVAQRFTKQVICLPIYSELNYEVVDYICHVIRQEKKHNAVL